MALSRILGFMTPGQKGHQLALSDAALVAANATTDTDFTMTIGRKADAAVDVIGSVASEMAYIKAILNAVAGSYLQLDTLSLAAGAAGAAWRDAAFNRILTVSGVCRIRMVIRVSVAVTAGGNVRLGTTDDADAILNDQVAEAATVLGTIGNVWTAGGLSASQISTANGLLDFIINTNGADAVNNIGITWSAVPTAGRLVINAWWQPLESGSTVAVGAGEAT